MNNQKITAHCLVQNEERFIWYSIMSVIEHVNDLFIWDTGSTDNTVKIIKEINKNSNSNISFKKIGKVDENEYSNIRQKMLDETKNDWILILDGDEIWWDVSIKKVISEINKNPSIESIVVPTINMVGDMYHKQEEKAGRYEFGNQKGHFALRFINMKIPGLHIFESYGKEGYADQNNTPIQDRNRGKSIFLNLPYIHTTHLKRSSKDHIVMQRNNKFKYEIGNKLPLDYYYPEVFFRNKPNIVENIWQKMSYSFYFRATLQTPIKKIKRRLSV